MSKRTALFVSVFLTVLTVWAEGVWDHYDTFVLKKDGVQHVTIHAKGRTHELAFGWTLYGPGGLILRVRYDGREYQPVLFNDYKRRAFRLALYAKEDDASPLPLLRPYALLVFKSFDARKKEATIELKIRTGGESEVYYTKGK